MDRTKKHPYGVRIPPVDRWPRPRTWPPSLVSPTTSPDQVSKSRRGHPSAGRTVTTPAFQSRRYPCTSHPFDHPTQWRLSPVPCDKDQVVRAMICYLLADLGQEWTVTWTPMRHQPHGGAFAASRRCQLCMHGTTHRPGTASRFRVLSDTYTPRKRYPNYLRHHPYFFLIAVKEKWNEHRRNHFEQTTRELAYPDSDLIQKTLYPRYRRLLRLCADLEQAVTVHLPVYARLGAIQLPETDDAP